jgi:hypothetical protein
LYVAQPDGMSQFMKQEVAAPGWPDPQQVGSTGEDQPGTDDGAAGPH